MLRRPKRSSAVPGDRILIVSASMGAGHDGAARELRARLEASGHQVSVLDFLPLMPFKLGHFIRWFYGQQLSHAPATYQWHYKAMQENRFIMWLSKWYSTWARGRLKRKVRRFRPDAVVSTYPLASQALGTLRSEGRLPMPVATYMTDFSVHPTWTNRYIDLHLTVSPGTAVGAAELSGRPAVASGPLVPASLAEAMSDAERAEVRVDLGLPADGLMALVVAGSWGVGNLGATCERLSAGGVTPVVVCGRNQELADQLAAYDGVVALGWRKDMPRLLRASDVLVENAGGLTAMEAFRAGIPVISHECIPGHGSHNASEMAAAGVVTWVQEPDELVPTVLALAADSTEQCDRARALFAGDPAEIVAGLAQGRPLQESVRRAGLVAVGTAEHALSSPLVRARRRTVLTTSVAVASFFTLTSGVALATNFGVGVDTAYKHHKGEAVIVVRLSDADLPASSALVAQLKALHAAVAVDRMVVHAHVTDLRLLEDSGVMLVNGGGGQDRGLLHPTRARNDLINARRDLARVEADQAGVEPNVFVPSRKLSALDLGTAYFGHDTVVKPSEIVHLQEPSETVKGGSLILVDGRTGTPAQLVTRLQALGTELTAKHLTAAPLAGVLPKRS